jgi:hypothetical protein
MSRASNWAWASGKLSHTVIVVVAGVVSGASVALGVGVGIICGVVPAWSVGSARGVGVGLTSTGVGVGVGVDQGVGDGGGVGGVQAIIVTSKPKISKQSREIPGRPHSRNVPATALS